MKANLPPEWNKRLACMPSPHALQTREWAHVKAQNGWQALPYILESSAENNTMSTRAMALILQRSIPIGGFAARLRVLYVPKGPLLDWQDAGLRSQVFDDLVKIARRQGAIFIKIDPDVIIGTGEPGSQEAVENPVGLAVQAELQERGWRFSDEQIQFRNTVLVDLRGDEVSLLNGMKQKTRYNIRLAERKGVLVRKGGEDDLRLLYRLYAQTSVRDGFVIREESYYLTAWRAFLQAGLATVLVAEANGETLGGVILFHFGERAWYMYGMSSDTQREKMPNYLLQWEAMRAMKRAGCLWYDLWGAPDIFEESDPMWGVYRFKQGLGGRVTRYLGAWDMPVQPFLYHLYTRTLPRFLDWMRRRGKDRTRQFTASQ